MPNPAVALGGASIATGIFSANKQASAVGDASDAQVAAAYAGMELEQERFDEMQELLAPYVEGGTDAFQALTALTGLSGAEAQQEQIDMIEDSPELAYMIDQGEEALLANASATGGIRGGNTQAALSELRPALIAQQIGTQYDRLGGLASLGQASAAGVGSAGLGSASTSADLLAQAGAAQAGGALGQAQALTTGLGSVTSGLGYAFGSSGMTAPEGAGLFSRWGF